MSAQIVVVTPEHVEIRLTPAGLGGRFLAMTIDLMLIGGATALSYRLLTSILPGGVAAAASVTLNFVITWGYHLYFEVKRDGRSPGKRMLGLRVVDARGLPITAQQSMVRNVVRVLDSFPLLYGLGGVIAFMNPHHRRIGDLLADTVVVEEEIPADLTRSLAVARHYNSLRTPRTLHLIRHRIGLEEREFLLALCLRADQMTAEARYDLMEEAGRFFRERLDVEDPHLSGENLVRDLTGLLFSDRLATKRAR